MSLIVGRPAVGGMLYSLNTNEQHAVKEDNHVVILSEGHGLFTAMCDDA